MAQTPLPPRQKINLPKTAVGSTVDKRVHKRQNPRQAWAGGLCLPKRQSLANRALGPPTVVKATVPC
jgi:hypothetical protein